MVPATASRPPEVVQILDCWSRGRVALSGPLWGPSGSAGDRQGVHSNPGIPLRDVQRLLHHARAETTLGSYDITGEALERHASHQVAGFLAGWAG